MRVTDDIHINAAPDVVWAVTVDVERWPEWTPTVSSVRLVGEREFGLGSVARIGQPMQPESEWTVTEFSAGRRFAWTTRRTGIRMTGTHDMVAEGGGTRNVLAIDANGWLAVLLWPLLRWPMRKALADENRGLKARCEQPSAAVAG
jgi:carbon monoxide dehydrogenase subunit G